VSLRSSHFSESRNVPTELLLSYVVRVTKKWMASCDKYHPLCAVRLSPRMPTRILDIGKSGNENGIKLIQGNEKCGKYAALSYCWGTTQTVTTTKDSLPIHLNHVAWQKFPRTFQDAIILCWAMDIHYLWIDGLCIIQDDVGDWERESANMASVYTQSYLTIAATLSPNSNQSLFSDRWSTYPMPGGSILKTKTEAVQIDCENQPLFIRPSLHLAHDRFIQMDNAKDHLTDAPLMNRAWGFQERLLPSRTLHFHAEELVYECNTSTRCECGAIDHPLIRYLEDGLQVADWIQGVAEPDHTWLKPFLTSIDNPNASMDILSFAWLDFVSEFSRLDLTYETDRLPALSGLAKRFSRPLLGRYLAGIWQEDLAAGLLYQCQCDEFHTVLPQYRPKAPSWSWSSIPLQDSNFITYRHIQNSGFLESTDFSVVAVMNEVIGENPFGWVSGSVITVRGRFCNCSIFNQFSKSWDLRLEHSGETTHEETPRFFSDGRVYVEDGMRLSCIYVGFCQANGNGYGLVLQRTMSEGYTYRRVGLMVLSTSSISSMSLAQIDLV
jgi:hypothetical protein